MYNLKYKLALPQHISEKFTGHATLESAFSKQEIEKILTLEKTLEFSAARIHQGPHNVVIDTNIRAVETVSIQPDADSLWLYHKIEKIIAEANHDLFLYDLTHMQTINFMRYKGNDDPNLRSKFTAHCDVEAYYKPNPRMLSMSIMLSGDDEYEGGDFYLDYRSDLKPEKMDLNQGDLCIFKSTMTHYVEPVIKGERKVLVVWVCGKGFL